MILRDTSRSFVHAPEGQHQAVLADVTEPKLMESKWGPRECFKFVFETGIYLPDGNPIAIWSAPFTASLSEKSNLRKFLQSWFGRPLTSDELPNAPEL